MSDGTEIAWTDATWNPLVGCSRVSAGCENCYAERFMHRGLHHKGLTRATSRGPVWTGEVRLVEKALDLPLRWRKPRRVFVNSLSDLFHEGVPDETIDRVFAVTALALHPSCGHTFQILTKRAERMLAYCSDADTPRRVAVAMMRRMMNGAPVVEHVPQHLIPRWPLPNVWLGVSCEDQAAADERIPLLLQTPAAVRFVSAEPLLSAIDFGRGRALRGSFAAEHDCVRCVHPRGWHPRGGRCTDATCSCRAFVDSRLDWIIVGGESGPGARPCDVAWIRSIVEQCKAAGTACFVKQLGAVPVGEFGVQDDGWAEHVRVVSRGDGLGDVRLRDRKGADPREWPEDLRVQEMPR